MKCFHILRGMPKSEEKTMRWWCSECRALGDIGLFPEVYLPKGERKNINSAVKKIWKKGATFQDITVFLSGLGVGLVETPPPPPGTAGNSYGYTTKEDYPVASRFCKNCGDKLDKGEYFCDKCGMKVE